MTALSSTVPTVSLIRLNKLLASKGLCSRREADKLISGGLVKVNGLIVSTLGARVDPTADLQLHKEGAKTLKRQFTVLLNKPLGIVSSQAEHGHTPAVQLLTRSNHHGLDTIDPRRTRDYNNNNNNNNDNNDGNDNNEATSPRRLPGWSVAGRLDINSTGLLVLTQAGRVVQQVIGNHQQKKEQKMEKEYLVRVNEPLTHDPVLVQDRIAQLLQGIECTGELLEAKSVEVLNEHQLRIVLTAGRKHHIRRMITAVDWQVQALKRVRIGNVVLGDLPVGCWRYMKPNESFV